MKLFFYAVCLAFGATTVFSCKEPVKTNNETTPQESHKFNTVYTGNKLNRIAFPIGGIGAGMFCIEGTGAISHMSVRGNPDIFNEPAMFAAISVKGIANGAKVLEGMVPEWKKFGVHQSGLGSPETTWGLPRFREASFLTRFPFAEINLKDKDLPLDVSVKAWSPFIPGDADNSSLPAGAIEYTFKNTGTEKKEMIFSYNSRNFMKQEEAGKNAVLPLKNGFVLSQEGTVKSPEKAGAFAAFTDDSATVVDYCWFRGGWWDPLTMAWNAVRDAQVKNHVPVDKDAPGASLYVPFTLEPGQEKTIRLMLGWYVPDTKLREGEEPEGMKNRKPIPGVGDGNSIYHKPWYSSKFKNIAEVADYWRSHYADLRDKSTLFSDAFYKSTLPAEVTEAVAANLTIIKSPTVLRQYDGRLWNWEGCGDSWGSCHGSCTHVWNYAQAIPHLFPSLERTLRNTEFEVSQNAEGHQTFRTSIPIRPVAHSFYAAADGQLGGIMKVYRDWHISGNDAWLKNLYPKVKTSLDYCIKTWDPRHKGVVEEPHHNTYDIEFWGADPMITSFYLGALKAFTAMGKHLGEDVSLYEQLYNSGKQFMETSLYNGEYFFQKPQWTGLNAADPVEASKKSMFGEYSEEALAILQKEGPKYQYGSGCLSDGVLGDWIADVCGISDPVDPAKVTSHLMAVYKYNLKKDLSEHANPQRPGFAFGTDGGLLLCSWPKGGKPSLPFVYSDEVWTGIEYQVASHLMLMGKVKEGLEIVRTCRSRYDGSVRNPFNEYECGSWYARAMASYGLIQGLTGVRYDAVDKTLYVDSKIGDFTSFIATDSGFGDVTLKGSDVNVETAYGKIDVQHIVVSGKTIK
ncbi:MAG: GH116 family glycosyl hydrolase [Agriterribacter sp.]